MILARSISPPQPACRDRVIEWAMTVSLIQLGVQMIIWPDTVFVSAFRYIAYVGYETLVTAYLVSGVFRMFALIANGHWSKWGPTIRAAGALLASIIWLQMSVALVRLHLETGSTPSPGIGLYATLSFFEIYSVYRAVTDGRAY